MKTNKIITVKKYFQIFTFAALLFSPSIYAANSSIGVEFYVNDSTGAPMDGSQSVDLGICDSANGGTCYCETSGSYIFENGFLGTSLDCSSDFENIPATSYLRMSIGSSTVSTEVQAVPYALSALQCEGLAAGNITINGDLTVTGSITGGSFVGVGGGGSGDITSVIAGVGLTGGGATGDVTLTSVLGTSIDSSEIVDGAIVNADVNAAAAIAYSKLNLSGSVVSADITDGTIANADISGAAAIAYSKVNLANSILSADITDGTIANADVSGAAAIAYSKLNLANSILSADITDGTITTSDIADGTIANADVNAAAAIAYSKLNLAGSVVGADITDGTIANADVNAAAAIAYSKLNLAGSITSADITDGTIVNGDILDDTIDLDKIDNTLSQDDPLSITSNGNSFIYYMSPGSTFSLQRDGIFHYYFVIDQASIQASSDTQLLMAISDTQTQINLSDATTYTSRLCHSGADGANGPEFIADCNAAGQNDLAEYYGADDSVVPGDVVMFDGEGFLYKDKNNMSFSKAYLAKSDKAYDDRVMGVVSTNPFSEVLGEGTFDDSENPVPLALVGRVPVNVTNENGTIKVGDYLTSSNIPGFAMKATKQGHTIGMALEDFNQERGQVLMFIKPGIWAPPSESPSKGTATFSKGQDTVQILLPQSLDAAAKISATPLDNPDCFYWVEKKSDSFIIKLSKKTDKSLSFDWVIMP